MDPALPTIFVSSQLKTRSLEVAISDVTELTYVLLIKA